MFIEIVWSNYLLIWLGWKLFRLKILFEGNSKVKNYIDKDEISRLPKYHSIKALEMHGMLPIFQSWNRMLWRDPNEFGYLANSYFFASIQKRRVWSENHKIPTILAIDLASNMNAAMIAFDGETSLIFVIGF